MQYHGNGCSLCKKIPVTQELLPFRDAVCAMLMEYPSFRHFPPPPHVPCAAGRLLDFQESVRMMGEWRSSLLRERMNPEKRQQKTLLEGGLDWQPHQDSNLEILNQNQVCYQLHYGAVCSGVSAVAGRSKPHGARSGKRKNPNGGNMPLRRCPEQADADSISLPW